MQKYPLFQSMIGILKMSIVYTSAVQNIKEQILSLYNPDTQHSEIYMLDVDFHKLRTRSCTSSSLPNKHFNSHVEFSLIITLNWIWDRNLCDNFSIAQLASLIKCRVIYSTFHNIILYIYIFISLFMSF